MLDGYWSFGSVSEFARTQAPYSIPHAIVVGIAYEDPSSLGRIVSPDLNWDDDLLLQKESAYGENHVTVSVLAVSIGLRAVFGSQFPST